MSPPRASAGWRAQSDSDAVFEGEYLGEAMVRDQPAAGPSFHSPLVAAGWLFAVLLPPVGLVIGIKALRKPFPQPLRAQAAAIVAVSVFGSLMWGLILIGAPGSHGFFTS